LRLRKEGNVNGRRRGGIFLKLSLEVLAFRSKARK